jgi:hypothetical protein
VRSKCWWLIALMALALGLPGAAALPAAAHGTLDQRLNGDPECNATNFKAFTPETSVLRQGFMPVQPGLAAVALCVNVLTAGSSVTINIRSGTPANPGASIATASATLPGTGFQWLHLDLPALQQVLPVTPHLIELPPSAAFQWRGTCAQLSPQCPAIDNDRYQSGGSGTTAILDFGFRTFAGDIAIAPTLTADQKLAGDPACGPRVFGRAAFQRPARQEFVPSLNGLTAVDLCINARVAQTAVTINIRDGTVAAPGPILQTEATTAVMGYQWVRVTVSPPLEIVPGKAYLIELPAMADFEWRGTCGSTSFPGCSAPEPDAYPAGVSSEPGDFGFRTIASALKGVPPKGTADQKLAGDPGCGLMEFRGFYSGISAARQEFASSATGLTAVDLCINVTDASASVTVNIRTRTGPDVILQTETAQASGPGFAWFRVTLDPVLGTTPGTRYVLELPTSVGFQWRSKCGFVTGSCTSVDADAYPLGASTQILGADFGFRTIAAPFADVPPTGTADQKLTGDPGCGPTEFRGFSTGATTVRQEFVPSAAGLSAIDLCINVLDASAPVAVNIRAGTATAPGAILQSESANASGPGFIWFRVAIDPVLATTPGTKYVIELPGGTDFEWRAKCGEVSGDCTTVDADAYTPGVSTRPGGADYGFRTIAGTVPGGPTGTADQKLAGDPACNATTFKGFATAASPLRQEFVPAAGVRGLDAVDLCLSVTTAGTAVTVNIRLGTVQSPGPLIGVVTVTPAAPGFQFLRFDLVSVIPTLGGTSYVIEVPTTGNLQWRGTCGAVQDGCSSVDADQYPQGGSSIASIRDFGFRTIAGTPAMRRLPQLAIDGVP